MNKRIYGWIKSGLIDSKNIQKSLELAGERPKAESWLQFIKQTMVLLGLLSLAVGVVFFFAYNWNDMGREVKFVILQVLLLGIFLLYLFKNFSEWVGQAVLLAGILVLGALLALFGQTYQTGADPWQLFATWALLIVPLVVFCRSEVLWVLLACLLNTSLVLYIQVNNWVFGFLFSSHQWPWVFMLLNGLLLLVVETISGEPNKLFESIKLNHRWAAQVLGLTVFYILGVLGGQAIFGNDDYYMLNLLLYVIGMAIGFVYYRFVEKDLLLLTGWVSAVIFFVMSILADTIFDDFDAGGLLVMSIGLIGMSTFAISWIKKTHKVFKQGEMA